MPFIPVQAMQLYHGVESPANAVGEPQEVPLPPDAWPRISAFTSKVMAETIGKQRETALILQSVTVGSRDTTLVNSESAATLIFVEGFHPAVTTGSAGTSPYWLYTDQKESERYVPRLEMVRTDSVTDGLVLHRHLRWMVPKQDDKIHAPNPNNIPGSIGTWLDETDHAIYQGDSIFLLDASITLKATGAQTASVWLVRLADVPKESERTNAIWMDNTDPEQSGRLLFVLGELLEQIGSKSPPVLYLGRRPIVNSEDDEDVIDSEYVFDKVWPGLVLGVVEEFAKSPEDDLDKTPTLTIAGSGPGPGRVFYCEGGTSAPEWKDIGTKVDLRVGDAFYALDSKLTMTVNHASVAYIRTAGVDTKRSQACNGRAC